MKYQEKAVNFSCGDNRLFGILSTPHGAKKKGILFVVGGPQYRAGSHRQFTLLARQFASHGVPAMRFDYRGMGDSEGEPRDFTRVDEDIRAAIDSFFLQVPELNEIALWGLRDGASGALFYAHHDPRVTGLVLLNPWVRTEQGAAKAYLKHYYVQRLFDGEFWKKIITGQFSLFTSARSFFQQISKLRSPEKILTHSNVRAAPESNDESLPQKMARCLRLFKGRTLIILCGEDLTAQEFADVAATSQEWKSLMSLPQVSQHTLAEANHTFSQRRWREQIGDWTIAWVNSEPSQNSE